VRERMLEKFKLKKEQLAMKKRIFCFTNFAVFELLSSTLGTF